MKAIQVLRAWLGGGGQAKGSVWEYHGHLLWSQCLHLQAMAPGEKRKLQSTEYLLGLAYAGQPGTHNIDGPLGGLVWGQGVGRARDVVRGQDGHEDGSNMMRGRADGFLHQ